MPAALTARTIAARRRPAKTARTSNTSYAMIILMGMSMLAIAATYWHLNRAQFEIMAGKFTFSSTVADDTEPKPFDSRINKKFIASGVLLGMTAEMVHAVHPGAQSSIGRNGEPLIKVLTPRGILVAWLADHENALDVAGNAYAKPVPRVYRLRVDEVYTHIGEQGLMEHLGGTYGRPMDTNCAREELGGTSRCTYRWWGGNGIEVKATTKIKVDANGRNYTQLTTIATNTLKSAKLQAARF